jgi:hypothetical protein
MDKLLNVLKTVTDSFNLGRLVFYPLAGALILLPLDLITRLLLTEKVASFQVQLLKDLNALGNNAPEQGLLLLGSTVIGFLLASASFVSVIASAEQDARDRCGLSGDAVSFPHLYVKLGTEKENYADWLIAEYFRFLEIVVHFPVALVSSCGLMGVYSLTHRVVYEGPAGVAPLVFGGLALVLWVVWRLVWRPMIVDGVAEAYVRSKDHVYRAVRERDGRAEADVRKAAAEAGKAEAEVRKLHVEVDKLEADVRKVRAGEEDEARKLAAERRKLEADVRKVAAEAGKAEAELERASFETGKAEAEVRKLAAEASKAEQEIPKAAAEAELAKATARLKSKEAKDSGAM